MEMWRKQRDTDMPSGRSSQQCKGTHSDPSLNTDSKFSGYFNTPGC